MIYFYRLKGQVVTVLRGMLCFNFPTMNSTDDIDNYNMSKPCLQCSWAPSIGMMIRMIRIWKFMDNDHALVDVRCIDAFRILYRGINIVARMRHRNV